MTVNRLGNEYSILAKKVVVCCGSEQDQMFGKENINVIPIETWHFEDNTGLPPTLIYYTPELPPNECIYWT